jgi:hypothetical protein
MNLPSLPDLVGNPDLWQVVLYVVMFILGLVAQRLGITLPPLKKPAEPSRLVPPAAPALDWEAIRVRIEDAVKKQQEATLLEILAAIELALDEGKKP